MDEILKYAVENGMLDYEYVQQKMNMDRRKGVIDCHKFKV